MKKEKNSPFTLSFCQAPNLHWMNDLSCLKAKFMELALSHSYEKMIEILDRFHFDWEAEAEYRINNLGDYLSESDLFDLDDLEKMIVSKIYVEELKDAFEQIIENINSPHICVEDLGEKESYIFSGGEMPYSDNVDQMRYLDLLHASRIINEINNIDISK